MKLLRGIIIGLFVVLAGLTAASEWYARTQVDRTPPTITCEGEVLEVSVEADRSELLQGTYLRGPKDTRSLGSSHRRCAAITSCVHGVPSLFGRFRGHRPTSL